MTLRIKESVLKTKLQRKCSMKQETVKYIVTKLLPSTWKREADKQVNDYIHDEIFDRKYEAMLKEKNIVNAQQLVPRTRQELAPQRLFDYVTVKIDLPKEEHVVIPQVSQTVRARDSADAQSEEQKEAKHGLRGDQHHKVDKKRNKKA